VDELRRGFHDRLALLHDEVGALVDAAVEAVATATAALLEGDVARAERVAAGRDTSRELAVEHEVFDLLALQGPLARDLRFLMASLRIAHEAELSHGLAANIAMRAGRLDRAVLTDRLRPLLYEMGAEASGLLRRAAQAYRALDERTAEGVVGSDGTVRMLHRRFLAELFALRDTPTESAVELGVVARCYERITDHAVEIAERVRFVGTPVGGDVGGDA
jgi:phosphate transport system protein